MLAILLATTSPVVASGDDCSVPLDVGFDSSVAEVVEVDENPWNWWGQQPTQNTDLLPLTEDLYVEIDLQRNYAQAVRLELVTGYSYTFCVEFNSDPDNPPTDDPKGDVYLFDSANWRRYQDEYEMTSEGWETPEEVIDMIPVEWRDMVVFLPFRDAHAYEEKRSTSFSTALDNDNKAFISWFGDNSDAEYFLALDNWNNSRPNDASVVDGDTFYLGNGDKVRMLGINTPESGRPYAQEATDFLTNMILGKEVTLVNDSKNGDSDSYGRLLAHVYVDDTFVNYEIIKAGFAFWYPYTSGTDFDSEYEEAQDYASNNMAGLWTESSYNLTIDYIEYDPEGDEAEGEYVVLTNHENYNVSMVGWFLQDEAAQTAYEFDFIITNNTSIRIYTGDGTDNATTLFWGWHQGIWNNSGDFAIIQDENGYMVDSYRYD